jgi:hypothetical protein
MSKEILTPINFIHKDIILTKKRINESNIFDNVSFISIENCLNIMSEYLTYHKKMTESESEEKRDITLCKICGKTLNPNEFMSEHDHCDICWHKNI